MLQEDVAAILGTCLDSITGWENSRSAPQVQFYPKIVEFLGYFPLEIDTTTLAGKIKMYRYRNGLSIGEMGRLVKVNPSTITGWETGNYKPSVKSIKELQKLIN